MTDTTKLEGIFNDIKDSVDRLEGRVGGVERRIAIISHEIDEECIGDRIVLEIPVRFILWAHMVLGVIIAIVVFRLLNCIYQHGGI
jgi:hypothetical protein